MIHSDFRIGAWGWRHLQLRDNYYPSDLPEDWQFSYYSNEFNAVVVPCEYFKTQSSATMRSWIDDCDSEFKFYIELLCDTNNQQLLTLAQLFGDGLAGVIISSANANVDSLLEFDRIYTQVQPLAPLFADQQAHNLLVNCESRMQNNLGVLCSIDELQSDWVIGKQSVLVTVPSTHSHEPIELRKMLESCLSKQTPVVYSLLFTGDPPEIEEMRTAQMIYSMLL